MRISAVISDVHANLPALDAVIEHAQDLGAQRIWNLGDHIGYNAFPNETINRLRELQVLSVIGDYDRRVLVVKRKLAKWRDTKHPVKLDAFLWAESRLSEENRDYLGELPRSRHFEYAGFLVYMSHGSPAAIDDGLTETTEDDYLRQVGNMVEADVLLGGDSHRAFQRRLDGQLFVNPGSVGRPDDGDPRASYALLRFQEDRVQAELYRLEYDLERAVEGLIRNNQPQEFEEMIRRGRNYNYIEQEMQERASLQDSLESQVGGDK